MPIYTYRCVDCNTVQEELRRVSDMDEVRLCPECTGEMKRDTINIISHSGDFTP